MPRSGIVRLSDFLSSSSRLSYLDQTTTSERRLVLSEPFCTVVRFGKVARAKSRFFIEHFSLNNH